MNKESMEKALERFVLISPLLEEDLEAAERRKRRCQILSKGQISERTLRRYLQAYRQKGLNGLMPKERSDKGQTRTIPEDILKEAISLKQELPQRSVTRILQILEGEKLISPGDVARSTLTRHLTNLGLTQEELKQKEPKALRRFQKEHRNKLWQADVKYGPYLPDPDNPKKKIRTYLICFIDDATRLICHGEFYLNQKLPILEDCFRKAILKRGIPDAVYVDNGKIFVSTWFKMACARLNIRHIHTMPYSAESKGKVERINRTVEDFLAEVSLQNPKTLEELNKAFFAWVEEGYNHHPHSSLEGETPAARFQKDTRRLRFANIDELRDAFLREESRKVDKTGCVKLCGKTYEVGLEWIRKTVDLRYDPFDLEEIEVWHKGQKKATARPLIIGEYNEVSYSKKDSPNPQKSSGSRLLSILEKQAQNRMKDKLGAIPFRRMEGGEHNV